MKSSWKKVLMIILVIISIPMFPIAIPCWAAYGTVKMFKNKKKGFRISMSILSFFIVFYLIGAIGAYLVIKNDSTISGQIASKQNSDTNEKELEEQKLADKKAKQEEENRLKAEADKKVEEERIARENAEKESKKQEEVQALARQSEEQQVIQQATQSNTVYCNQDSKIYHTISNCSGMKNSVPMNENDAISNGYRACRLKGGCRPKK